MWSMMMNSLLFQALKQALASSSLVPLQNKDFFIKCVSKALKYVSSQKLF